MGESKKGASSVNFDNKLKLEFHGEVQKGLHKNRNFEQSGFPKSGLSLETAKKLPQKRKILTVQADLCKIIGLEWRKLWFIGV